MMPSPNLPVPQGAMPTGEGMGEMPESEGSLQGGELQTMLVGVLTKVKSICDKNGIDFQSLVSQIGGESGGMMSPSPEGMPVGGGMTPPAPM